MRKNPVDTLGDIVHIEEVIASCTTKDHLRSACGWVTRMKSWLCVEDFRYYMNMCGSKAEELYDAELRPCEKKS